MFKCSLMTFRKIKMVTKEAAQKWQKFRVSHGLQRRSPAEVRAMATTKIGRIRAAIASLGPDDIEERASLEAALACAEHLASVPPVDRRDRGHGGIHRSGKEAHRSRIHDRGGRKAETNLRAGIGTGGERSDRVPSRGRNAGQWFSCSDRSCVCSGGRSLASPCRAGSIEGLRPTLAKPTLAKKI